MAESTFCAVCQLSNALEYDAQAGGMVCFKCGTVGQDTSGSLVVLGRVLEGEEGEFGRNFMQNGGTGYAGADRLANGKVVSAGNAEAKKRYHNIRRIDSERYIRSLLHKVGYSSLFGSTSFFFTNAKARINFKWGEKAQIIAVVCIYIAARKQNKPLRLFDLANAAQIDIARLTRAQTLVKNWLCIEIPECEPIVFLEQLIVHLSDLLASSPTPRLSGFSKRSTWTPSTLKYLRSLKLSEVRSVAASLLNFSHLIGLSQGRAPEHVAIAAIIVAMEAVGRSVAVMTMEIMAEMSFKLSLQGTFTCGERYRELNKLLEDYAPRIPWLGFKSGVEIKKKELVKHSSDIINFGAALANQTQSGDEKGKMPSKLRILEMDELDALAENEENSGDEEVEDEEGGIEDDELLDDNVGEEDTVAFSSISEDPLLVPAGRRTVAPLPALAPPRSRRSPSEPTEAKPATAASARNVFVRETGKKRPSEYIRVRPGHDKRARTIEQAAASLASAFGGPPPSTSASSTSRALSPTSMIISNARLPHPKNALPFAPHDPEAVRIRQQLLAGHTISDIFDRKAQTIDNGEGPSRLAKLLWLKTSDEIDDDELFGDGEMESFLRSDAEVAQLKGSQRFAQMPEASLKEPSTTRRKRARKPKKPKRIFKDGKVIGVIADVDEKEEGEGDSSRSTSRGLREGTDGSTPEYVYTKKTKFNSEMRERFAKILAGENDAAGDSPIDPTLEEAIVARELDVEGFMGEELEEEEEEVEEEDPEEDYGYDALG